jgi:DNA-binding response OmpR family regulator
MKTILLVDDDQQLRTVYGLALRKSGYNVLEADSGVSGLEMARHHLPDLILSDINMPGGDGSSLLRNIRSDPKLRSRQVVLITGKPDFVTPRKGMEAGADDFLMKPVSFEALLGCVQARFKRESLGLPAGDDTVFRLRAAVPSHLPHEFFTPVAGIIGLMEVLRASAATLTSDEVTDIHNDIYLSALRLNRTLRNYLHILDLETAHTEELLFPLLPRQAQESIQAGIDEALRLNDRRQDVTVRMEDCSLSIARSDLSRLVEELVDNAFKFSKEGTPVDVELSADGRLTVTDHGRGLSVEKINCIGAFQQFDRRTYEQQGLGLGLVLVQKLAVMNHAVFSMTSQSGQGTRVQIAFSPASRS